jgi:hypothetical protein
LPHFAGAAGAASGLVEPEARVRTLKIAVEKRTAGGSEKTPDRDVCREIGVSRDQKTKQDDSAKKLDRSVRRK